MGQGPAARDYRVRRTGDADAPGLVTDCRSQAVATLTAGLIDKLRTHIAPVTLGAGERLFEGVPPLQLELLGVRAASLTTHISYRVLH
jgi:dihydrofolate reductase